MVNIFSAGSARLFCRCKSAWCRTRLKLEVTRSASKAAATKVRGRCRLLYLSAMLATASGAKGYCDVIVLFLPETRSAAPPEAGTLINS